MFDSLPERKHTHTFRFSEGPMDGVDLRVRNPSQNEITPHFISFGLMREGSADIDGQPTVDVVYYTYVVRDCHMHGPEMADGKPQHQVQEYVNVEWVLKQGGPLT